MDTPALAGAYGRAAQSRNNRALKGIPRRAITSDRTAGGIAWSELSPSLAAAPGGG